MVNADMQSIQAESITALLIKAEQIGAQSEPCMQVSCAHAHHEHNDATLPSHEAWQPMLFACMAAYGIRDLYIYHDCDVCAPHQAMLDEHIEAYAYLSEAMSIKLRIHHGVKPYAQNTAQQASVSRRAFFRTVIPSMAKQAGEQIKQSIPLQAPQDIEAANLDARPIPLLRKLFLHLLPQLGVNHTPVPVVPALQLGNIQADDACTACGDCVDACATQALSLRPFGQRRILEFYAACCTGCNQCVNICPEQVMESLPGISLPTLLQDKARPLTMVLPTKP